MTHPKIAIIGAGPGGCMLARLLYQYSIPCTIFEGETSIDYRSQGGSLDLRSATGLAAVKAAGLWERFLQHARYDGESLLLTDKNLTTWMRRRSGTRDKHSNLQEAPEIDRAVLRKMLIESVPAGYVRWGWKLTSLQETTSSGMQLIFANGETLSDFDLVIGADGAWSKTRKCLSQDIPHYSGLSGWDMQIMDAKETAPEIHAFVNHGSVFAYSDGKSLSGQQLGDGSINVSHYGQYTEDFTAHCGFDAGDLEAVKRFLLRELDDWAPQLKHLVESVNQAPVWRNLYEMPVGWKWPHKRGVTLLGDAAHVMTPFAGIGVNTAFHDAMELTKQIVAFTNSGEPANLNDYIVQYEKVLFEHAHSAQALTEGSKIDMLFTPNAPRATIESWILRHAKADVPVWAHLPLTAFIYAGYWVYKWFV
ncbi:tetracycline resistance protein from transposon [Stagonosporopsis vannaccii]|nr:tetracycline resistance protein from transposon [Stagonosporopsis vannaccii]